MAFALTLFVQTATRRMSSGASGSMGMSPDREDVCALLFDTLCADVDMLPAQAGRARAGHQQTTLYTAFRALCGFYEGDPLQAAVCARVLAFHFLMERTAGAALTDWVEPIVETPELVGLHPAVVDAIGTVPLNGTVLLSAEVFRELVGSIAATEPVPS